MLNSDTKSEDKVMEWLTAKLEKVHWDVKKNLIKVLEADRGSWKELVSVLPGWLTNKITVHQLENEHTPAFALMQKLEQWEFTVAELISCLEALEMYNALLIIKPDEELQITQDLQESEEVEVGNELCLSCQATGFPTPFYQWLKDGQELLEHHSSRLSLDNVCVNDAGDYYCKVYTIDRNTMEERPNPLFSSHCTVVVTEPFALPQEPPPPGRAPEIELQPRSPGNFLPPGVSFTLDFIVTGDTPFSYLWFKDNQALPDETGPELHFRHLLPDVTTGKSSWKYSCLVSNKFGKAVTETVTVNLSIPRERKMFTARDKVALLIANENYKEIDPFTLPSSDVATMSNLLTNLGFRVMAYLDLGLSEMHNAVRNFCQELDKGVYALFYFAGHGFADHGQNYMQPVDVSKNYIFDENFCVDSVASAVQERDPAMSVFLLDMCRERPIYEEESPEDRRLPRVYQKKKYRNTVFGYATSFLGEAFEVEGQPNGLFVQYLKKHLADKKSICEILLAAMEDISNDATARRNGQDPSLELNLPEARSLRDPILNPRPENDFLKKMWKSIYKCPAAQNFSLGPYKFWVTFRPHKDTFCNAMDVAFKYQNILRMKCTQFAVYFEPACVNVKNTQRDVEMKFVIQNLQLLKEPLRYTVMLQGSVQEEELARYTGIIGLPGIVSLDIATNSLSAT